MRDLATRILLFIGRVGADPLDTEDMRLQKAVLVAGSIMYIFTGALWGLLYFVFGQRLAGIIPMSYAAVSLLSITLFCLTHRYRPFLFSQLVLILLLPFFLTLALGGFVNSSAVILWSLLCPFGALLFDGPRNAIRWLLAYLGLVILVAFVEPILPGQAPMPASILSLFFVINVGSVSAITIMLLAYFVHQKDIFKEKSEDLLLNILPKEIAAILKDERRTIAERHEEASILFADMVDFTPMSAEMSPAAMVNLLNEIFSHFDDLVGKYDLEKIKTVGDCYMVAAGVPRPRPDHAQVLVQLALEMRQFIREHTFDGGRAVDFRIGINSGTVLAGVIGRRKFIYDLWGDEVNLASRMESHGSPGAIQITRATYQRIRDEFICEPRGLINVKGKGDIEVWHVKDRKTARPDPGEEQAATHTPS